MYVEGQINGIQCSIMLDTGAGISIIGGNFYEDYLRNSTPLSNLALPSRILAANGQAMNTKGSCQAQLRLGDRTLLHDFKVIDEMTYDVLIGNDCLNKLGPS